MQFDDFEGACTITLHTSNLILPNTYERRLLLERSSPTTAANLPSNLLNFRFFLLITFLSTLSESPSI
jgi:hypothetical protein